MRFDLSDKADHELLRLLRVARKMREVVDEQWPHIDAPAEWSRAAAGLEGLATFELEWRAMKREQIAREVTP